MALHVLQIEAQGIAHTLTQGIGAIRIHDLQPRRGRFGCLWCSRCVHAACVSVSGPWSKKASLAECRSRNASTLDNWSAGVSARLMSSLKRCRAGQVTAVPGDVLARDAYPAMGTVKQIQLLEVFAQDVLDPVGRRGVVAGGLDGLTARGQVGGDVAEDPGTPLGRASDHDSIGAGVVQNTSGLSAAVAMSPLAISGIVDRLANGADRVVLGRRAVGAGARASVHGQRGDARTLARSGRSGSRCGSRATSRCGS